MFFSTKRQAMHVTNLFISAHASSHSTTHEGSQRRSIRRALAISLLCALSLAGCSQADGQDPSMGADAPSPSETPPGATPTSEPTLTPEPTTSPAEEQWEAMSLEQQVASILMLHYPGTDASQIASFVEEIQPGGLILMGDNMPWDETELAASIANWDAVATAPLLIGIDEEGGTVRRLEADVYPAAPDLRDGDPVSTEIAFHERGTLLESLGINANFGVIADVTADTYSSIWPRVLG